MPLHGRIRRSADALEVDINPVYARDGERGVVPKFRLSAAGMHPETALQVVRDELMLDGNARLNLATFVTTWMEPSAAQLMTECFDKNMIDKDEYPQTAEMECRCVNILADLWNAPSPANGNTPDSNTPDGSTPDGDAPDGDEVHVVGPYERAVGCSTTGSSEACMLAGLALLWRWRERQRAAGRPTDRPNLVMGSNVQICWKKFCRYWQVEERLVPMQRQRLHLGAAEAAAECDENTIGVVAIMGSTMDGSYEPVQELCEELDGLERQRGISVPIHVDAASGGFVAPFLQPEIVWDFRVPRVASINASGHKYGLVYPGVGWIVWRDKEALPDDLVFRVDYLGGELATFALNFSRPGAQVAAQYFNFLRLGFEGYRQVQQACQDVAVHLAEQIAGVGVFELLTDGRDLPVFAFKLRDDVTGYTVFDISERLRIRGWLVPAYHLPLGSEDHAQPNELAVLRIVVKNGFSHDLADLLLAHLREQVDHLASAGPCRAPVPAVNERVSFHH